MNAIGGADVRIVRTAMHPYEEWALLAALLAHRCSIVVAADTIVRFLRALDANPQPLDVDLVQAGVEFALRVGAVRA